MAHEPLSLGLREGGHLVEDEDPGPETLQVEGDGAAVDDQVRHLAGHVPRAFHLAVLYRTDTAIAIFNRT